jgi:hypothetical protein
MTIGAFGGTCNRRASQARGTPGAFSKERRAPARDLQIDERCNMKRTQAIVVAAALSLAPAVLTGCKSSQSVGAQVDDAGIKAKVKAKLAADVRLSTITNIEVNSTNGVVTLAGQVPNHLDKVKAEEVARSVQGVARVNNELQVEKPERM